MYIKGRSHSELQHNQLLQFCLNSSITYKIARLLLVCLCACYLTIIGCWN